MADDSYPGENLLVGGREVDELKTPARQTGGVFFMRHITRNRLSTCLEEIQDPAEQINSQILQELIRGSLSIFQPRALDSLGLATPGKKSLRKKSGG